MNADQRRFAVANALAAIRLEGGDVGADMQAMAEGYEAGDITIDQLIDYARRDRSVQLPGGQSGRRRGAAG